MATLTGSAPPFTAAARLAKLIVKITETIRLSKRLARRIRREGPVNTAKALIWLLRPAVWDLYRLESLNPIPSIPGVEVHEGVELLRRLREGYGMLPDDFYHDGRPGFKECFTATLRGELAGIIWVREGPQGSRWIALGERQVEVGCLVVLPANRNKGIGRQLYWRAAAHSLEGGATDVFALIAHDNLASRRAAEAVGFRRVASVRRRALWGPRFAVSHQEPGPKNPEYS